MKINDGTGTALEILGWLGAFAACLAVFLLTGCAGPGMIDSANVDGTLRDVLDRHDAYVDTDEGLSDLERRAYLRDAQLLREVLNEARSAREGEEGQE